MKSAKALPVKSLYLACSARDLPFTTTKQLTALNEIIGQDRAHEAIEFAVDVAAGGYNIYAAGRNGLGKRTMLLRFLKSHNAAQNDVFDWCYIGNFADPREPQVLRLPAGKGRKLKQDVEDLLKRMQRVIPQAFDNESYFERSEALKRTFTEQQEKALSKLSEAAKAKSVSVSLTTPGGYRLMAMNGDQPYTAEEFEALPEKQQDEFEQVINRLEKKLRVSLRDISTWEQEYSDKQQRLNEEVAHSATSFLFDKLITQYEALPQVVEHLQSMQKDLVDNLDVFLEDDDDQTALSFAALDRKLPRRYQINVLVSHEAPEEVPVVIEEMPNYHNLFGYVESVTYKGTVLTDFTLIRPGSLHEANGGYLLMDADKVLEQPFVWDGLKRALRAKRLEVNALEREMTLSGTVSLEPEPIPLNAKVILLGTQETLHLLQEYDPDFIELFKVVADFENEMQRTPDTQMGYARFITSLVTDKGLRHCDRAAVMRLVEFGARLAESQNKLSLHASDIANLLREANFWAGRDESKLIRKTHVEKALQSSRRRASRVEDQLFDTIRNGSTLISTQGRCIGQINALSVLEHGGYAFGLPNRLTANCFLGEGDIIDIERDVKLGGNIHSKGVLILSSYLAARFGRRRHIKLSASLTFEQSYYGIDGDSASLAELCALLSAMADVPIQQNLAVTGSINQFGEVQPIGGVNEKIEGFFRACQIQGLSGDQGVVIPVQNVQSLMLDQDVLDAVKKRQFAIYAVAHVDEALPLLTGVALGKANKKGRYPAASLLGKLHEALEEAARLGEPETDQPSHQSDS